MRPMNALCAAVLLGTAPIAPAPRADATPGMRSARPDRALREPGYLSPTAREFLHTRMRHHGEDMQQLLLAVTLLDRERTQRIAERISTEPRLARPSAQSPDELNVELPARFFELQDELLSRTATLARAAAQPSGDLAVPFGRVVETCVSCHTLYLDPLHRDPEGTKPAPTP